MPVPAPIVEEPGVSLSKIQLHGFLSQGAFISTDNDYIGRSSRGSVDLFQAGLTASSQITERLRVGMQFISLDNGFYGNFTPQLDWGFPRLPVGSHGSGCARAA